MHLNASVLTSHAAIYVFVIQRVIASKYMTSIDVVLTSMRRQSRIGVSMTSLRRHVSAKQ